MPITADNFNKVVVYFVTRSDARPKSIRAFQDDTQVDYVPYADGRAGFYDTESDIFGYITDAIHEGDADHHWNINGTVYTSAGDIPNWLEYLLDRDPIRPVLTEMSRTPDDIGPDDKIYYKYLTVDADNPATAPSVTFDASVDTLDSDLETLGWYDTPNEAYTNRGTHNTLYSIIVTFFYNGAADTNTIDITTPETDAVQYSTDHGETWTTTAPSDYDDVTDIRYNVGGHWVDHVVRVETELVSGIEDITGFFYPPYSGYPYSSAVFGENLQHMEALQIRAFRAVSWTETRYPDYGGQSQIIPLDDITYLRPHLIDWEGFSSHADVNDQPIQGFRGQYILTVHKKSGEITIGHADQNDLSGLFSYTNWTSWVLGFESYPYGTFAFFRSASATQILINGSPFGLAVGNIFFVGDEQMRLDSIESSWIDDGVYYTTLRFTRGVNGTTAADIPAGTPYRAVINEDKLRRLTLLKVNGLFQPFAIKVVGHRKRVVREVED